MAVKVRYTSWSGCCGHGRPCSLRGAKEAADKRLWHARHLVVQRAFIVSSLTAPCTVPSRLLCQGWQVTCMLGL